MSDVPLEHSLERWTGNQCINFIGDCKHGNAPFFAWLTFDRPHMPTTLPREIFEKIRPDALTLPKLPDVEALTNLPRHLFKDFAEGISIFSLGEERYRFILATYYSLVEYLDSEIGACNRCA